ncbi:MAG: PA14 domain-containing protein [Luteolibacter sp.]
MAKTLYRILFFGTLITTTAMAQDGGQLYQLYCSACHGEDGKGANDGIFPPLAGSDWLQGNPKRAVSVILKGLEGPVEVSGKPYNLAMPPHGASMNDRNIRAIFNYISSSWGNSGEKIAADLVSVTRAEHAERKKPWTAPELLKLYPLPIQKTALENLTSRIYKGQWEKLPDFENIEAENIEEELKGVIDLALSGLKDHFGVVWEGDFIAPEDGTYLFGLLADDGARIILNGKTVCELTEKGSMRPKSRITGKINLSKGANPIRIEYFEANARQGIEIRWKNIKSKPWDYLTKQQTKAKGRKPIPLSPTEEKTVIYRNFINGTTPRAIGFGFPGGLNLAYSADNLAPELVWTGDFIDASLHWTGRGKGFQKPSSKNVEKLTSERYLPEEARFKGYTLDPSGNPTFLSEIGTRTLSDSWKPGETGTLVRTLELSAGGSALEIPLGNSKLTGSTSIKLEPGTPATVIYKLK